MTAPRSYPNLYSRDQNFCAPPGLQLSPNIIPCYPGQMENMNPYDSSSELFNLWALQCRMINRPSRHAQREAETTAWLKQFPELAPKGRMVRRIYQPPFKLYESTLEDLSLRLTGTLVVIGDAVFRVEDIRQHQDKFILLVRGKEGKCQRINHDHPMVDFRTPDPQYISLGNQPVYFYRYPKKQQSQGFSTSSSACKIVGVNDFIYDPPYTQVMQGFEDLSVLRWKSEYAELLERRVLSSLRLSPFIAVFKEGNEIAVEYKGRKAGVLHKFSVIVDKDDENCPWVQRDVKEIGCGLST